MKRHKILFVTSNRHKFKEIRAILENYNVRLEQLVIDYTEDKEDNMEEVCEKAAKELADKLNKEIIVEDTGLYFNAYNNFPGASPKFVINGIGFAGIFRLLKDKDRSAYFKSVIGYGKPGEEPKIFAGIMSGKITAEVITPEKDTMPYDHIFIPDSYDRVIARMSLKEKNSFSQRGKAAKKFGEYLQSIKN